jgi:hypothetical protein
MLERSEYKTLLLCIAMVAVSKPIEKEYGAEMPLKNLVLNECIGTAAQVLSRCD